MTTTSTITKKINSLTDCILATRKLIEAGCVPLLRGAPGAGKTAVIRMVAKQMQMEFFTVITSVMEPVDANGLPIAKEDEAIFLPFGIFNKIFKATVPTLVLIDDIGQASPQVQSALMQIIHGGRLNDHQVSPMVKFAMATNRRSDRAGAHGVISALMDRAVPIDFTASCTCSGKGFCPWHTWAIESGINPVVAAFAKFVPKAMAEYEEQNIDYDAPVCTARSLEALSKMENLDSQGIDPSILNIIVEGIIGARYAASYIAFRAMYKVLPTYERILLDPENCEIPDRLDQQIAITTAISHLATDQDLRAISTYVSRMPSEISTACMMGIQERLPMIKQTSGYRDWVLKNNQYLSVD